jgi:hypothetical protein
MKCKEHHKKTHHKLETCASCARQLHFLYIGKLETMDTGYKCKYLTLKMYGLQGLLHVEIIICISMHCNIFPVEQLHLHYAVQLYH